MPTDKKNSSWLAFQYFLNFSIGLLGFYLILALYKEKLFGAWLTLASLWGIGSALDFGFGLTVIKYVAQYNNEDKSKINELLSSLFLIYIILGFIVFIIMNSIAYLFYFDNPLIIPSFYKPVYQKVFVILGIAFIFQYTSLFLKSVLEGLNQFVISSRINIIYITFLFAGIAIVTTMKLSLIYLSFAYLFAAVAAFMLYVITIRRRFTSLKIDIKLFNFTIIKEIYKYSFSVQLTSFFTSLIDPLIKYIIGNNYKVDYIPVYELARRASAAISGLFFTAFKIILPKVSILKTKEEYNRFILNEGAKFTRMGLVYSGFAFGILSLPILFILHYIFKYDDIIILFLILGLGETINNVGYTIYMFILGIGKAYFIVFVQFINVVIISSSLVAGFELFHNAFGLLGYFITVVIVNMMTFAFVRNQTGMFLKEFLSKIGFMDLVYLVIMILTSLAVVSNKIISYEYALACLSVLSLLLFYKDIKSYINNYFNKKISI